MLIKKYRLIIFGCFFLVKFGCFEILIVIKEEIGIKEDGIDLFWNLDKGFSYFGI